MPPSQPGEPARPERAPNERVADHAEIDRLTDELLPALVAKLSATGLGEIEVREGGWKVRLRRPGDGTNPGRRAAERGERPSRSQPGHAGHGHAPAALEGHRSARSLGAAGLSGNGHADVAPVGPGDARLDGEPTPGRDEPHRQIARSPAVGIFQPRPDTRPGTRVRAGDRIAIVDMLGVPQDVLAPADGVIGAGLVEPGEAVEYGQDLIVIDLAAGVA